MKILQSVRPGFDVNLLIDSGLDEAYIGLEDKKWNRTFGIKENLNRMSDFHEISNFRSLEEIEGMITSCRNRIPFYLTLNAPVYNDKQRKYILRLCDDAKDVGISAFIVGEPPLAKILCDSGFDVIISTISGVYNSLSAQYYCDLGAKRIILPRDLTLNEMELIIRKVPNEYEVFGYGNGCRFSDSACLGYHCTEHTLCSTMSRSPSRIISPKDITQMAVSNNRMFYEEFHRKSCAICAMYRLNAMGVSALKIVGRANDEKFNIEACKTIRKCLELVKQSRTEEEYLIKVEEFRDGFCKDGLSCYYPEVRYP